MRSTLHLAAAMTVFLASTTCGGARRELLVEVTAAGNVAPDIESVSIIVLDGTRELDRFDLLLQGVKPDCLPFSIGIAPEDGNEDLPFTVRVEAKRIRGKGTATLALDTTFSGEPRYALFDFSAACISNNCNEALLASDVVNIDLDEAQRRIESAACLPYVPPITALECVARNGCFGSAPGDLSCYVPCPDPPAVSSPDDPREPTGPAAPDLRPCPEGWSERGTPITCEPWPLGQVTTDCPQGQAHFPSRGECRDLSEPCPAGRFAIDLPPGRKIFVDEAVPPGGDGATPATAYQTVEDALSDAESGSVIAVAKGDYGPSTLSIDRPLYLIGACPRDTRLRASLTVTSTGVSIFGLTAESIDADGGALTLIGVTLLNARASALRARGGASVGAFELVIRDAGGVGIDLSDGTVTATRVVIDRARGIAARADGEDAWLDLNDAAVLRTQGDGNGDALALVALNRAKARIDATIFEEMRGRAIDLDRGASFVARSSLIREVGENLRLDHGIGIRAEHGAEVGLNKIAIERTRYAALYANTSARVRAADWVVRDVGVEPSTLDNGEALICDTGCDFEGERIHIERASRIAIAAQARLKLTDLFIADTSSEHGQGEGLVISEGANVELRHARIEASPRTGVRMVDSGSSAVIEDLIIPDPGERQQGIGVEIDPGTHLILRRAAIDFASTAGIRVNTAPGAHAAIELEDLAVRDTRPNEGRIDGYGLQIGKSSGNNDADEPVSLELLRGRFERNTTAGIGLSRTDPARIDHVRVEGTRRSRYTAEPEGGVGIAVTGGTRLEGSHIELFANTEAGLFVGLLFDAGALEAYAALEHIRIEGTTCAADGLGCNYFHGAGAGPGQNGRIQLSNFAIRDNKTAGVSMFMVGEMDLFDGLISDETTGAYIQIVNYDFGRLIHGVTYKNNDINFSTIE